MSLVITIDDSKPIEVQRFEGKIPTGKRKMYTDDFLRTMLGLMNKKELLTFLVEENFIENIQEYIRENVDKKAYIKILQVLLDRIKVESGSLEKNSLYVSVLNELLTRINLQTINPLWLKGIFESVMKNLEYIDEGAEVYQQLLMLLLKKGNVSPDIHIPVLSTILKVASDKVRTTTNKDELKIILEAIARQVDGEWIEQILANEGQDRVVYRGFMPKNVLYYTRTLKKEIVVIDVPKGRFDIKYHDVVFKQVGHPRLLFTFVVSHQNIVDIRIVAVKDKIITEETQLYHYPYSNVFESGKVCWSYGQYHIDTIEKLQHIPYIFLNTPNNTHLNTMAREMYMNNEEQDFDDEILKPMGVSFKEYLER